MEMLATTLEMRPLLLGVAVSNVPNDATTCKTRPSIRISLAEPTIALDCHRVYAFPFPIDYSN